MAPLTGSRLRPLPAAQFKTRLKPRTGAFACGVLALGMVSVGLVAQVQAQPVAPDGTVLEHGPAVVTVINPHANPEGAPEAVRSGVPPEFSESNFARSLNDSDGRINPEFRVPVALNEDVSFWMRVYTEYTTRHIVLFDRKHLGIVYEAMDFTELDKTARNRAAYEITLDHRVRARERAYRLALLHLAKLSSKSGEKASFNHLTNHLTEIETKIQKAIAAYGKNVSYLDLAHNVHSQTGQADCIESALRSGDLYLPMMEKIFEAYHVPPEITRLSLVESSFNINAVSKVGATGVWQFMNRPAREYLLVDEHSGIDERRSPLKATIAAAQLLRRNRKILGSWALAVISYQHGLRGLRDVPEDQKSADGLDRLFHPGNHKIRLGFASRNYYVEFLAVLHAEAYRDFFYGAQKSNLAKQLGFVKMDHSITAQNLSKDTGLSLADFHKLNPDVTRLKGPLPKGFWVTVPSEIATSPMPSLKGSLKGYQLAKQTRKRFKKIRQLGPTTLMTPGDEYKSMDHARRPVLSWS